MVTIEIGPVTPPDMAMPGLAMPDLAMPDLAPYPDLSMPDLAPYPDLIPPSDLMPLCAKNADCQADGGIKGGACCMVNGAAACVDVSVDTKNCGACGKACAMGSSCCNGTCSDPMTDIANCGACGIVCPAGATCSSGICLSAFVGANTFAVDVKTGDFNGDGKIDFVISSQSGNVNAIGDAELWLNSGNGNWGNRINVKLIHDPNLMLVGDFNNDKLLDFVTGSQSVLNAEIQLGDGKGGFTPGNIANSRLMNIGVLGEFDGDGNLFIGNGDGTFKAKVDLATTSGVGNTINLVDMNGDKVLDAVFSDGLGNVFAALGDGKGSFVVPKTTVARGNRPRIADFDGDGHPDVLALDGAKGAQIFYLNIK